MPCAMRSPLLLLRRHQGFRYLWLGQTASLVGSHFKALALSLTAASMLHALIEAGVARLPRSFQRRVYPVEVVTSTLAVRVSSGSVAERVGHVLQ